MLVVAQIMANLKHILEFCLLVGCANHGESASHSFACWLLCKSVGLQHRIRRWRRAAAMMVHGSYLCVIAAISGASVSEKASVAFPHSSKQLCQSTAWPTILHHLLHLLRPADQHLHLDLPLAKNQSTNHHLPDFPHLPSYNLREHHN